MRTVLRHLPLALAVAEKAIQEFSNQWLAGLRPQLSLETGSDGQIWVHSRVAAGDVPTRALVRDHAAEAPGCPRAGQHHRPRRRGPAYQRRLQRRAAAREAASTADKAVEIVEPAGEAVKLAPDTQVAVQLATDAQVAAEVLPAQAHHQNFWSLLRDELCPDTDYSAAGQDVLPRPPPFVPHQSRASSQNIPQVDGSTLSHHDKDQEEDQEEERVWSCKCCTYETFFETEDDLHKHHDRPDHMLMYEECNICYPWHVWT